MSKDSPPDLLKNEHDFVGFLWIHFETIWDLGMKLYTF